MYELFLADRFLSALRQINRSFFSVSVVGLGSVKTALGMSAQAAGIPGVFQAAITAISGLTPTMFITRVRL
jgi:hypothetical protein